MSPGMVVQQSVQRNRPNHHTVIVRHPSLLTININKGEAQGDGDTSQSPTDEVLDSNSSKTNEKNDKRKKSWIKRISGKIRSDDKKDASDETSPDTNEEKNNGGIFGFMAKARSGDKKNDSNKTSNINEGKNNGVLGFMGKAFKRTQKGKVDEVETILDDSLDPTFNSEVSLQIEFRRQRALNAYEVGDDIPNEFLPKELIASTALGENYEDPPFNLDKVISNLNDNIFYIDKNLELLRIEQRRYSGDILPLPSDDEKRLNKLKRELEATRKNVILDEQTRKKNITLERKAKNEKARTAAARENKKEKKSKGSKDGINDKKGEEDTPTDNDNDETNGKKYVKKLATGARENLSNAVDGVVGGAQTAFSNVWKSVRNDDDNEWITVCRKTRISPGEVFPVVAGGVDLLVIGSKDGTKIHCIANTCPHLGTPLETGMVIRRKCGLTNIPSNSMSTDDDTKPIVNDGFEDCIVCPLHQTAFSLDTGEVNGRWCPYPPVLGKVMGTVNKKNKLPTFNMRTKGKNIEIKITSSVDIEPN
jgi:nitrite reductase/ring-hydroxylating ferredoxin subunit